MEWFCDEWFLRPSVQTDYVVSPKVVNMKLYLVYQCALNIGVRPEFFTWRFCCCWESVGKSYWIMSSQPIHESVMRPVYTSMCLRAQLDYFFPEMNISRYFYP